MRNMPVNFIKVSFSLNPAIRKAKFYKFHNITGNSKGLYLSQNSKLFKSSLTKRKQSLLINPIEIKEASLYFSFQMLSRWKQVLGFHSLRVLIAPVIEHLLVLDRMLALQRSGYRAAILPVFNQRISPRNVMLITTKINQNESCQNTFLL